jgi:hypothetical protein
MPGDFFFEALWLPSLIASYLSSLLVKFPVAASGRLGIS